MINTAIWQPRTDREVSNLRHVAGLYGAGVIEVWDMDQLRALTSRHGGLVSLEKDTHATPLESFRHPEQGLYLIGPQNGSIPHDALDLGRIVQVETESIFPLMPHVAAAVVLHDRHIQMTGVRA